jgi:hypothetical protein
MILFSNYAFGKYGWKSALHRKRKSVVRVSAKGRGAKNALRNRCE